MSPEETPDLILEHGGLAFLPRSGAWRIARDGITMRPLGENRLRLVTNLAMRSDSKSRLVNEFVGDGSRVASDCVVGGRQNDCRVAILFELTDNLFSGEGA
jgi:hypothetical protein